MKLFKYIGIILVLSSFSSFALAESCEAPTSSNDVTVNINGYCTTMTYTQFQKFEAQNSQDVSSKSYSQNNSSRANNSISSNNSLGSRIETQGENTVTDAISNTASDSLTTVTDNLSTKA
ncbi:MAG: hypothetical protein R3Y52_03670, partial [Psittacicella sp.]